MTLSETLDRLIGQHADRIDFKDGSFVVAMSGPMTVDWHDGEEALANAWVEPTEEGLVLHFNAGINGNPELRGQDEPLFNIARIQ